MTHTPGPWTVETWRYAGQPRLTITTAHDAIAQIHSLWRPDLIPPSLEPKAEEIANANLIAAAPALLEAAKWVIQNAGYESGQAEPTLRELNVSIKHLDALKAAIAKAEGREMTAPDA